MLFSWEHLKYQNWHPGAHFGTSLGGSWGGWNVPWYSCWTNEYVLSLQFVQCISDIGGVLGIWIGVSAISLTEVIHLLLALILILIGRYNRSCNKNRDILFVLFGTKFQCVTECILEQSRSGCMKPLGSGHFIPTFYNPQWLVTWIECSLSMVKDISCYEII